MPDPDPSDERRHDATPGARTEEWSFVAGTGTEAVLVAHLVLDPGAGRAAFTALVRNPPERAVLVAAVDLAPPRPPGLEVRGPGIWADHVVEEPFERWSLGLEAFGVGLDVDPDRTAGDLLAAHGHPDERGDRTPVGWDLEWHATGPVERSPLGSGYVVPCRVEGEVLLGDEVWALDRDGRRDHRW